MLDIRDDLDIFSIKSEQKESEVKDQLNQLAPPHCRNCNNLYPVNVSEYMTPYCQLNERQCSFQTRECPELSKLSEMCLQCDSLADCHIDHEAKINTSAIEYCRNLNEHTQDRNIRLINHVIFNKRTA